MVSSRWFKGNSGDGDFKESTHQQNKTSFQTKNKAIMSNEENKQLLQSFQLLFSQQQEVLKTITEQLAKNPATTAASTTNKDYLLEVLNKNITTFNYDPDNDITFSAWFSRYRELFEQDGRALDDNAKVRLLIRHLGSVEHNRYINIILPQTPADFGFDDTIKKLSSIFDKTQSLFNIRYRCLQITKNESDSFITYAANVNKSCEAFKLNNLSSDQFKCLIFVMGLQSARNNDVRARLLSLLESEEENGAGTLTLEKLLSECNRISNLKRDAALVEQQHQSVLQVKKKVNKKFQNQNSRAQTTTDQSNKQPKTPCWGCGQMHFSRNCPFKDKECPDCHKKGHKSGYCHCFQVNQEKSRPSRTKTANKVIRVNTTRSVSRKYVSVAVNGKVLSLQLDHFSCVAQTTWTTST